VEENKMTTTKSELIKYLSEDKKLPMAKIQEAWTEKEKEARDSGITEPEQLELMTMRKVSLYFRKLSSSAEEIELTMVPLGLGPETDYGAKNKHDEAKKIFESDPNRAILEGYTNEQGTPLWRNSNLQSRNGKPILPERELRRNLYFLGRRQEDTTWKLGILSLNGEALKRVPEMGKQYKTHAILGKGTETKWHGDRLIMYSGNETKFETHTAPTESLHKMIGTYAKDVLVPFSQIFVRARMDTAVNDFFFVKVNVVKSQESNVGTNNRIVFSDPDDLLFDEDKQVTGWITPDVPLRIVDEALDVMILMNARVYTKKKSDNVEEEALQVNVFGYFAEGKYIKTEDNTPKVGNQGQTLIVSEEKIDDW
jgi:hypothetical protein